MTGRWTRVFVASVMGLLPAILGGMGLARLAAVGPEQLFMGSLVLGVVCALVVMAFARGRGWGVDVVGVGNVGRWTWSGGASMAICHERSRILR